MDINAEIMSALRMAIEVPVAHSVLTEQQAALNPPQYVTFFEIIETPGWFDDNDETYTEHMVQVDIWSRVNYAELRRRVKRTMRSAGWDRIDEREFYESDTRLYHRALMFIKTKAVEDDG